MYMYLDWQAWANYEDPDEMLQTEASDQGLHCLPLNQQLLNTTFGSKSNLFKFCNKCGKKFHCPNTLDKYSIWMP